MKHVKDIITVWTSYLHNAPSWEQLIKNVEPKNNGCGPIYEIPNPILRPNESFAIADMRNIRYALPHYHQEVEFYFTLFGQGLVVVGEKELQIRQNSVVVIPANIGHFTIPINNLILAVVNTPPFNNDHVIPLSESNKQVKFDKVQFDRLTHT